MAKPDDVQTLPRWACASDGQDKRRREVRWPHALAASTAWLLSGVASAQAPVDVDELFVEKGRVQVGVGVSYSNVERTDLFVGQPVQVPIAPGQFVTIPSAVAQVSSNGDVFVLTPSVKVGLGGRSDVYLRGSYVSSRTRFDGGSVSSDRLGDAWFGLNHRLRGEEGGGPGLIGFAEVALAENTAAGDNQFAHGKSASVGATVFQVFDPVAMLMTVSYRASGNRTEQGAARKPGALLAVAPSASFAANYRITLSAGFTWLSQAPDRLDGSTIGFRRTQTSATLGLAHGVSPDTTWTLSGSFGVSGTPGATLGLVVTHKFGSAPTVQRRRASESLERGDATAPRQR